MKNRGSKILAGISIGFGAIIILGVSISIGEGRYDSIFTELIGGTLMGAAPFAGGIYWYRNILKKEKRNRLAAKEKMILRLAERLGGKLSVLELAARTELSADESKEVLDEMYKKGLAEFDLMDNGTVLYAFRGTGLSLRDKNNASNI